MNNMLKIDKTPYLYLNGNIYFFYPRNKTIVHKYKAIFAQRFYPLHFCSRNKRFGVIYRKPSFDIFYPPRASSPKGHSWISHLAYILNNILKKNRNIPTWREKGWYFIRIINLNFASCILLTVPKIDSFTIYVRIATYNGLAPKAKILFSLSYCDRV